MFFGLTNSPTTFQHFMDSIFTIPIAQGWLKVFMDDMLIINDGDCQDMVKKIKIVLQICKENNLYIKPEKCFFFVEEVEFLGFILKDGTFRMDPVKVEGITEWPAPMKLTELQSFIGFCNFYRRFIPKYSDKCAPLNKLLKKSQPWIWEQEQQVAFETLKAAYASQLLLLCPDYSAPFRMECDASLYAAGGTLLQDDSNGDEHPVVYFSKAIIL